MASSHFRPERASSAALEAGLYVLRYVSSEASAPPLVHVRPSYGSEESLRIILPPALSSPILTKPGSSMVVLAEHRASLQLTVQAVTGSTSLDAELRLEPLHETASVSPKVAQNVPSAAAHPEHGIDADFELVGHVARRGDVSASPGRWLAGPDAPAPIEGIEILASSSGPAIEYQVIVRGAERWSDWLRPGQFAGSKGQALSLAGVRFRLQEKSARQLILKGSALFLGSSVIEQNGTTIEMRSIAGHDPLVGLMIDVVEAPAFRRAAQPNAEGRKSLPQPGERKGRVRVFRAGAEQRLD